MKKRSKPLHRGHRHCDRSLYLAEYLAPQTYDHAALTLGVFEITLNFLDNIEKELAKSFKPEITLKSSC